MKLSVSIETWPLATPFVTARGPRTSADIVYVKLTHNGKTGHGECMPHFRFNESAENTLKQIEALRIEIERGLSRKELLEKLPPNAARNAIDCAMWDLEAALAETSVQHLANLPAIKPCHSVQTISLDSTENMAAAAKHHSHKRTLKVKFSGVDDIPHLEAIKKAAPNSALIIDANEAWTPELYQKLVPICQSLGVAMIEQPFPEHNDEALKTLARPIPVYADESFHDTADIPRLKKKYDGINIKLDKSGGLTAALQAARSAKHEEMDIMVGCMVATSLAMAPAFAVASLATFIDLDGMTWLKDDRQPPMHLSDDGMVSVPARALWRLV